MIPRRQGIPIPHHSSIIWKRAWDLHPLPSRLMRPESTIGTRYNLVDRLGFEPRSPGVRVLYNKPLYERSIFFGEPPRNRT